MLAGTIANTIKMSKPIILGIAGGTGAGKVNTSILST